MDAREGSLSTTLGRAEPHDPVAKADAMDLEHRPEAVLSVLEADQLFTAKQHARFGRARLSRGARALLWALRAYVIAMLLMVAMQVVHTFHGGQ
jgi:hypothetical protein